MRTKNLFRTLVVACLAVVSISAFGQVTTGANITVSPFDTVSRGSVPATALGGDSLDATHAEYQDLVTVNSIMPYFVRRDPNVRAMTISDPAVFKPSQFNWRTVGAGATLAPLGGGAFVFVPDGGNALNGATWHLDTVVQVTFAATGLKQLWVKEESRNAASLPICTGADSFLSINVLPLPTVGFNEANTTEQIGAGPATAVSGSTTADYIIGGCSMNGKTIHFRTDVTGTDNFMVNVQFQYTPLGGTAGTWSSTNTADGAGNKLNLDSVIATGVKNGSVSAFDLPATNFYGMTAFGTNNTTRIDAFNFVIGANAYGKWIFKIEAVNDRVSRKSFRDTDGNLANGYANASNMGSVTPAASTMTLYSLPTPKTQSIRHILNNKAW